MADENHRLTNAEPSEQPDDAPRDENDDPVLPDDDRQETTHNLNESHDKVRLETDLTRGTGTRDQEKHKLKVRGETAADAAEKLSDALAELEERNVFTRAREVGNE